MTHRCRRLVDFLGLRRSMVGLLVMVVLVGMGERLAERFLPIYLIALGSGMLWPGFLNALDNLLSALYSFPGGYLADRLGVKRALLVFNALAMAGYCVVIFIPRWEAVVFGSFLFLSWSAISLPATMSLLADVLPKDKRTMGVSLISMVRRIPMALGPVLGGVCIDTWGRVAGVRIAFGGALAMAVVALFAQQFMIKEEKRLASTGAGKAEKNPLKLFREMSPSLRNLLVSDILIRFCEQIPYAYIVIWCMESMAGCETARVSGTEFGILTFIEMATAVAVYIPVAYLADRYGKKKFVLLTFVNFTVFPIVLFFSRSFWWLAVAFVVRGLKEFGEPTRKALIMDLAPEGKKAGVFGVYYLVRDTIVSLAAFAGAFLWREGAEYNLIAAAVFGVAGTVFFAIRGRDVETIDQTTFGDSHPEE